MYYPWFTPKHTHTIHQMPESHSSPATTTQPHKHHPNSENQHKDTMLHKQAAVQTNESHYLAERAPILKPMYPSCGKESSPNSLRSCGRRYFSVSPVIASSPARRRQDKDELTRKVTCLQFPSLWNSQDRYDSVTGPLDQLLWLEPTALLATTSRHHPARSFSIINRCHVTLACFMKSHDNNSSLGGDISQNIQWNALVLHQDITASPVTPPALLNNPTLLHKYDTISHITAKNEVTGKKIRDCVRFY